MQFLCFFFFIYGCCRRLYWCFSSFFVISLWISRKWINWSSTNALRNDDKYLFCWNRQRLTFLESLKHISRFNFAYFFSICCFVYFCLVDRMTGIFACERYRSMSHFNYNFIMLSCKRKISIPIIYPLRL